MAERVFGYARISVSHESIENQVSEIEKYCRERGYELLKIFEDTVTGASNPLDRPAFRKLLEYTKDFNVKKVVVYDISRLGRSLSEVFNTLRILSNNGIIVEFVKHQDLNNMDKRSYTVFVTALGLAVQLEREFMRQRLETARRAGKTIGRPPVKIPIDLVKKYLKMGLSKKDIYHLLVSQGHLRYREKDGYERTLTYHQFLKKLKVMGL